MFKFLIITGLPVLFLLIYLYRQDKYKPEPPKRLLTCFGLGMVGGVAGGLIVSVFDWLGIGSRYDSLFYSDVIAGAVTAAVMVSVAYFILWKYSVKNVDFDEFFDGPVYAACIVFGYQVMCDFFDMSSAEWYYVGLISIVAIVALYGTALYIGYFYSKAHFGKMEINNANRFKMWLYPFLILWIYNTLIFWYNTSVFGIIIGLIAFCAITWFVYKKNKELLDELKALDTSSRSVEETTDSSGTIEG